jgi:hypothetical protein
LGEEPWFRLDVYAAAFFQAVKELGVSQTVAVEGYNGAAPPDMERSVSCIYSQASMRPSLERLGVRFSNYGTQSRNGPTIGMALITLAHFDHPEVEMFRLGAMAPMFPFLTSSNDPVGISRDHRAFYDIMRRLNATFKLDLDLSELLSLGQAESQELKDTLEKIGGTNPTARELIDRARNDFNYTPFEELVELDPALDRTLEDILRSVPGAEDDT